MEITGATLSEEHKEELLHRMFVEVSYIKDQTQNGQVEKLPNFPIDTMLPFVTLYYATQFCDTWEHPNKFIELGFSPLRMKLLTEKQQKLLKPIQGGFYKEVNKSGLEALFQLIIDDNFFNSFTSIVASIDQHFSLRTIFKGNAKAKAFLDMLTTSTVGTILPEFINDYGENKKIDLVLSPSHSMFTEGVPGSRMSGIYMDKNGNWKILININA